jgi:hypothetical protein
MNSVKRELQLGIGVLTLTMVLLAFGSIGLLSRMAPAIDQILKENMYSIQAAEDMMVAVALSVGDAAADREIEGRFFGALERARSNVTLIEEPAVLDEIEEGYRRLLADPSASRQPILRALEELVAMNRQAMQETRDRASRLSEAGAWSMVLMAIFGFTAAVIVVIRTRRNVVEPLSEIQSVLTAHDEGDVFRRCQFKDASSEVRELMVTVNDLLDRVLAHRPEPTK